MQTIFRTNRRDWKNISGPAVLALLVFSGWFFGVVFARGAHAEPTADPKSEIEILRQEVFDLRADVAALKARLDMAITAQKEQGEVIAKLREELAVLKDKAGAPAPLPKKPALEARIAVGREGVIVSLDKGGENGVKEDQMFDVIRGGEKIGRVQVLQVFDRFATATVLDVKNGMKLQNGDSAVCDKP